jgi:hypothetical protein
MKNIAAGINIVLAIAVAILFYFQFAPKKTENTAPGSSKNLPEGSFKIAYFESDSFQNNFEYFKEIIAHVENINLLRNPFFWISTGYLFLYTGLFVLINFGEYFTFLKEFNSFRPIWDFFTNLIITILYSCLLVAFSFRYKQTNT